VRTKLALPKAKAACADPNVTVREHAVKALRALGESKPVCPAPAAMPVAKELAAPHGGTITFETEAGRLTIALDPSVAPVTATRVIDLARAGFFKGIVVHRVVPGFVAQFGDPGADGYGGSGTLLRSETTPKPFGKLDVGVALAGKDTGSSQLFVTLGRTPHLDGDYPIIGHADGDWAALAEGDTITDVSVKE
jgi:cyclophilin family peptidyl-prolyl cis-trans isomerase